MYNELKNKDLVIINNKEKVVDYLSNKLLDIRIMSVKEFKNAYFGYYDERAIYYLIKKYNYKYDVAKLHIENVMFDIKLKKELSEQNLLNKMPLFKESIKRIVVMENIDSYLKEEIEKYDHIYLNDTNNHYAKEVYEAETIEDEVHFVILNILKILDSVKFSKINLVNVGSEYYKILKRLFSFYNIPINLNEEKNIYGTSICKTFLEKLNETKDIEMALEGLQEGEIYNKIVDVINKYTFTKIDEVIIYCINEDLKRTTIKNPKIENAVNIISLDDINNDDKYYFVMNFNQGSLPKIYKDEDYLSDNEKIKYKILTSGEKNKIEKTKAINQINKSKNIILSYKKKAGVDEYYKSSLIDDLNLKTKKIINNEFNYSNIYNKIYLSRKLDDLIKYNKVDPNLSLLYSNYNDLNYRTYKNDFTKINNEDYLQYIDNKILLSYSSLDSYNKCAFKYYINNVLKLNKIEETFMTFVGNLFHYILSICFKDNFVFEDEFNEYIKNSKIDIRAKELFFLDKLKDDLLFAIEVIKNQDKNTELTNALYEQKIYVNIDDNIKITFMGIIDKLKYKEEDGKTIVAIIDYKTGNPNIKLNNIVHGLNMQLPIYLYLANNSKLENVEVAGFYLQKIIHGKLNYDPLKDIDQIKNEKYKLEGYSTDNIEVLNQLDKNYMDSNMIKSLKTTSKGFSSYSKIISKNEMDKLLEITEEKIKECAQNIKEAKFNINPKKIGFDLVGCEYCSYKDLCFKKEEDIEVLDEVDYKSFLGGENNA